MGEALSRAVVQVVAALLWRDGRFLICQRPPHKARGLQWEFVGGKVEPGETKEQALIRECREELGVTVVPGAVCVEVEHAYPDLTIRLALLHCSLPQGEIRLLEHEAMAWVTPEACAAYDLCPADRELLRYIAG